MNQMTDARDLGSDSGAAYQAYPLSGETGPWRGALSVITGLDPVIQRGAGGDHLGCRVTPGNDTGGIRRNGPMDRGSGIRFERGIRA